MLPVISSSALPASFSPFPLPHVPLSFPSMVACTSKLDRPFGQIVHSWGTDQSFVSKTTADAHVAERVDAVHRVDAAFTLVKTEGKFVYVALHMLHAELVVDAVVAALEDGPYAFDSVGMCQTIDVLLRAMADRAVTEAAHADVRAMLVSEDIRAVLDIGIQFALDRLSAGVGNDSRLTSPPRSRIPRTATLPTVPRPALSFLLPCLFDSLPPM